MEFQLVCYFSILDHPHGEIFHSHTCVGVRYSKEGISMSTGQKLACVQSIDSIHLTYIVLVLIKIGCPKNGGTLSSISECVLMKFSVASGRVRESL